MHDNLCNVFTPINLKLNFNINILNILKTSLPKNIIIKTPSCSVDEADLVSGTPSNNEVCLEARSAELVFGVYGASLQLELKPYSEPK